MVNASHQAKTSQTHLAWHYNPPHSVHTVTLITTFCKKTSLPRAHMHPFLRFSRDPEKPTVCIWWIMYEPSPKMPKLLWLLLCCHSTTIWQLKGYSTAYSSMLIQEECPRTRLFNVIADEVTDELSKEDSVILQMKLEMCLTKRIYLLLSDV